MVDLYVSIQQLVVIEILMKYNSYKLHLLLNNKRLLIYYMFKVKIAQFKNYHLI